MKIKILFSLKIIILLLANSAIASAQQALVRSYSDSAQPVGQAYLTHYGNHCLALLPTHVVEESKNPVFLGEGSALVGESFKTVDLGEDLSLSEIRGNISKDCGYSMSTISRAVGSLIKGQGIATLRSVRDDGSIARLAVAIIDDDGSQFIRVQPTNDSEQIRKGQSGSLLMINDQPVGMLLSIVEKRGKRFGVILRMDAILSRAENFLAGNKLQQTKNNSGDSHQSSEKNTFTAKGNDGGVIGWSILPIDAKHRATNLTDNHALLPWRARVEQWPVELELDIVGGKVAISKIELDGNGVIAAELPQKIEIFINMNKDKKRWRSLLNKKLSFENNGTAIISFAPTWARQIKIVIRSNHGANKMISLKRIRITGS